MAVFSSIYMDSAVVLWILKDVYAESDVRPLSNNWIAWMVFYDTAQTKHDYGA